jgi:RHS repeat-associated protein
VPWCDINWHRGNREQLLFFVTQSHSSLGPSAARTERETQPRTTVAPQSCITLISVREAARPRGPPEAQCAAGSAPKLTRRGAPRKFTGKEEDSEVGLTYFGKRFLNAQLGRWISADPLAVHAPGQADLNLYAYVSGSVLKNVDPLGLTEHSGQPDHPFRSLDQKSERSDGWFRLFG